MVTDSLRELWDRIDAGPPPVHQVLADGGRIKRRRGWTGPLLVAAAVGVIVGGGFGVQGLMDDPDTKQNIAATLPPPPDGQRWVGLGRAVVAVPDWWTTGETQCGAPVEDTVYFDNGALVDCSNPPAPATVGEVSALAVLDATNGYGREMADSMTSIGEVDGREVLEQDGCEEWFEGVCRRLFAVPSEGVVFAVTIAEPGDGDYEHIRDSLRILPETMTTVPLATREGVTPARGADWRIADALGATIKAADLEVRVEFTPMPKQGDATGLDADLPAGSLVKVRPELGSPVPLGDIVTVTLSGSPSDKEGHQW